MANNEKIKERFESEKKRIDELVASRDKLFTDRDNISSFGAERREAIRTINAQIKTLNLELSEIGRELIKKSESLPEELKKITKTKGKKDLIKYEIDGKEFTAHVTQNTRGKFNNTVLDINVNHMLLAYYKETVTIKEDGIVSQFSIDEDAVSKMSLAEQLTYYNDLCTKISNIDIVKEPAKSISLGKHCCIVNECDVDIYVECLERYKKVLIELETQNNDYNRLQAAQNFANQVVKIADAELSSFRIDWDLVNSFETLEQRAEYFNNLAKQIASSPKGETTRVPLGKNSSAVVNKCDKMIFEKCWSEWVKATQAIQARKKPSYTIDWNYVNALKTAEQKAAYFENLCGKIDAVEKHKTVDIPFRNHVFTINEVDAEVFSQAMKEFEKNYLQALKEKKEAEQARLAEIARKQEEERLAEEKRKEEERLAAEKKKEEERLEQERIQKAIEDARKLEEQQKQKAEQEEQERLAKLEELAKAAEAKKNTVVEPNTDQIVAETLAAINSGAETRSHIEERDDEEELLFINGSQSIEEGERAKEVLDIEAALNELGDVNPEEEEEVDFFDEDEEYEEGPTETTQVEEQITEDKQTPEEDSEDKIPKDGIQELADEFGGEIIEVNGLQIVDLSPERKQDKSDTPDEETNKDKKKRTLKDFFGGKKKDKNKDGQKMTTLEGVDSIDTIDLEIVDEDVLKVLASREITEDISESKFYTTQKALYLSLMDWIADRKITDKVRVETKRHTAEIDAKYESMYTFIANKYDKLEDRYERYANDKYHNLKVKGAFTVTALAACSLLFCLTVGKNLFAATRDAESADDISENIKYKTEETTDNDLFNTNGDDILSTVNSLLLEDETPIPSEIEEDLTIDGETPLNQNSSYNSIPYDGTSMYTYTGTNATEAFNMDTTGLGISEEDATDDIKRAAEANKAPLLDLVH